MKALEEATALLEKQLAKLRERKAEIEGEEYRLVQAIQSINRSGGLQRIRRKLRPATCVNCKGEFMAGRVGTRYCNKPACARARNREKRKGVVLVEGAH